MKQLMIAALVSASFYTNAQTFKPAVNLIAGKKYIITNVTNGSMAQEMGGQSMEIPMDVTTTSMLEVKTKEKNTCQLSSTTKHIVMHMSMMGQDMNYDSDKKEDRDGQIGQMLGNDIGVPVVFSVNNYGKLIEGSIVKKGSPERDAPGGNMMMSMLNVNSGTETSPAVDIFINDSEMKPGDSFTDSSSSADGKNKNSTTYTLAEIKDGLVKFTITGTAKVNSEMEMQGMQTLTVSESKITGEMFISTATGLLAKKVQNMTVTGTIEVLGMNIPISGTTTVTISVSEAGD